MIFVHPKFQEATKTCFNPALVEDDEFQIDGLDLIYLFLFQVIFLLHRFDPIGFITMNQTIIRGRRCFCYFFPSMKQANPSSEVVVEDY